MRNVGVLIVAVFVVVAVASLASSDEVFNSQLFRPSIFGGNFISIEDSNTLCKLGFGGGLLFDYAGRPFVHINDNNEIDYKFVSELSTLHLTLAFAPFSFMSIGAEVPIHYAIRRHIEDNGYLSDLKSYTGVGDVRAELKLGLLKQENSWLGLALAPYATFPTGDANSFLGEGRFTGGGNLILEHDFKLINIALNGGYNYRGTYEVFNKDVGDAWRWGAGISRAFKNGLSFSIEYWGERINVEDTETFQNMPMEILGTIRYQFGTKGPRIIAGGGSGLGYGAGAASPRVLAGIDYYHCKPKPTKGELLIKTLDQKGNLISAKLEIVGPKGNLYHFDSTGKWQAKVPAGRYQIKAIKQGYVSASAEPYVEVDKLSLAELTLMEIPKPVEKPTLLTVVVTDKYTGEKLASSVVFNPGADNEKVVANPTGELSLKWEPGNFKVNASAEGYETKFAELSVVKSESNRLELALRKKIEKKGTILFDYDSDVIKKESYPVLDDVVEKIKMLGEFKKIVIEGHCSNEGTDEYNMDLSKRRATAVKDYLVKKGIDKAKLEVEAYGETRPIASNDTEEGRAKNRRVEFIIEE